MWGDQGQKITWKANVTPEAQRQSGGWYDNPETGYNMRWWVPGQQQAQPVSQPVQQTTANQAAQMAQPVSSPNWQDVVSQATQMYQQAAQPQVTALEAQKPQAETRYQQLLNDITRQTTLAKSAEYSRRGIPLSSGAYESDIAKTNVPLIAQAGQIREDTLSNIVNQIAQAQSGALTGGIQTGMNLYGTQVQQGESAAGRALQLQQLQQQQQQSQAEQAWKQKVYQETTLPESQANIRKIQDALTNLQGNEQNYIDTVFGNAGGQTVDANTINALNALFGLDSQNAESSAGLSNFIIK